MKQFIAVLSLMMGVFMRLGVKCSAWQYEFPASGEISIYAAYL